MVACPCPAMEGEEQRTPPSVCRDGRGLAREVDQPRPDRSRRPCRCTPCIGEPDTDQTPATARLGLLRPQPLVAGEPQRLLERLGIIAAVVDEARGRAERVGLGTDEVAPADLGGIEAQALGHQIQRALHDEGAHGHPDAAIGAQRRLAGRHREGLIRVGRDAVRSRQDPRRAERLQRRRERVDMVGAGIRHDARAQRQERACRVRRRLDLDPRLAPVGGRGEVLPARLHPLDGVPRRPRQRHHGQILGEHMHLLAEAATRVRHDHAHPPLRETEGQGERTPQDMRELCPRPDGEVVAFPAGDEAARLDGRGRAAPVGEGLANHHGGRGEAPTTSLCAYRCLRDIARHRVVKQRRAGGRALSMSELSGSYSTTTASQPSTAHRIERDHRHRPAHEAQPMPGVGPRAGRAGIQPAKRQVRLATSCAVRDTPCLAADRRRRRGAWAWGP